MNPNDVKVRNANQPRRPFLGRRLARGFLAMALVAFLIGTRTCVRAEAESQAPSDKDRITFAYVWGYNDIGGIAITPGLLKLAEEHFPHYQLTTVGGSPDARLYIKNRFPDCDVWADPFRDKAYNDAIAQATKRFGGKLPELNREVADYVLEVFSQHIIDWVERNRPEFMQAMNETRLLIYPSSMMLCYGEGTLSERDFWGQTIRLSMPLLIARKLGIPYAIYAQSFGAFEGVGGGYYFKTLLEDATFVSCRDGDSVNYVRSLGIEAPDLMFVPDSTFSFGMRDDAWADAFMAKRGLKPKAFLVVVPRTWPRASAITRFIGKDRSDQHIQKLQTIITNWIRKTGMKVLIAAETGGEMVNARRFIYDPLPDEIKRQCELADDVLWMPEQAAAVYRQARILVTMEQHSFLLAIPEGTPTVVPIARESGRKIWMLRDFGIGEYLFDVDAVSAATIEQAIAHIHENYDRESDRLQSQVIPRMRAIENEAMKVIARSLENASQPGNRTVSP